MKLIGDCAPVIVAVLIRPPPLREQAGCSGGTLDRERQNEHHHLCSAIERCMRSSQHNCALLGVTDERTCGEDVVIFREPLRVPGAQVPLGCPRKDKVRRRRRVYPRSKAAHEESNQEKHEHIRRWGEWSWVVLDSRDDRGVQVIGAKFWVKPVDKPERNRDEEANDVSPRNPLITFSGREELV